MIPSLRQIATRLVDVPRDRFVDEVVYWRARTLRLLMAMSAAGITLWLPVLLAHRRVVTAGDIAVLALVGVAVALLYWLPGRGPAGLIMAASIGLPAQLAAVLVGGLAGNGIRDVRVLGAVSVVVQAALLTGRAGVLATAAGSVLTLLGLAQATLRGWIARSLPGGELPVLQATVANVFLVIFVTALLLLWEGIHRRHVAAAVASDRREREARMRVEAQDRVMHLASHELRTPLTALKGYAQIAQRALQRREAPEARYVASMAPSLRSLERLVDDLVDVARVDSGKLGLRRERCDLAGLCREVRHDAEAAGHGLVELDLPPQPVWGHVDPGRVAQVLTNLLTNAFKYSPADTPVVLGLSAEGDRARLWVSDRGPGIPEEELERIFDPYHRIPGIQARRGAGADLGLGLYLCRELVRLHGGEIEVESASGAGTTFRFSLPLPA